MAIVICDDDIYFDGRTNYWVRIDWDKCPWSSNQRMNAAECDASVYGSHERIINSEYNRVLELNRTT